jgi:hypothetical protein
VAYPAQTVDGELVWFEQGQSINDPGLSRTGFGIPTDCLTDTDPCLFPEEGLRWYDWVASFSGGPVLGDSFKDGTHATFVINPGFLIQIQMFCGIAVFFGATYKGLYLVETDPFGPHVYIIADQLGPEPTYRFSRREDLVPDPTDIICTNITP